MARLEAGDKAPAFTLPDQDGKTVSLKDFRLPRWSSTSTRPTTPPVAPRRRASSTTTCGLQPGRGDGSGHLPRRAAKHTHSARSTASSSRCSRTPGHEVMELRRLGREDHVRQEDDRDHPLHLPGRRQGRREPGVVQRPGRRARRQGAARSWPRADRRACRPLATVSAGEVGHHQVVRPPTVGPDQFRAVTGAPAARTALIHRVAGVRAAAHRQRSSSGCRPDGGC